MFSLEPYLYPFIIGVLLLPVVVFLYQHQYPALSAFNGAMLVYMLVLFFIFSIAVAGYGITCLGFQGESLRHPTALQTAIILLAVFLFFCPLIATIWFTFWRESVPFHLKAWFPLIVVIVAPLLAFGSMIGAEYVGPAPSAESDVHPDKS